jgi:hypothetical protein
MIPDPWEIEEDRKVRNVKHARYRARHRAERRASQREYQRARRARQRAAEGIVGHLHEVFCNGAHYGTRVYGTRRCRAVPVFGRKLTVAK